MICVCIWSMYVHTLLVYVCICISTVQKTQNDIHPSHHGPHFASNLKTDGNCPKVYVKGTKGQLRSIHTPAYGDLTLTSKWHLPKNVIFNFPKSKWRVTKGNWRRYPPRSAGNSILRQTVFSRTQRQSGNVSTWSVLERKTRRCLLH